MAAEDVDDSVPTVLVLLLAVAVVALVFTVVRVWRASRPDGGRPTFDGLAPLGMLTFAAFTIAAAASWLYAESWPLVISLLVTGFVVTGYGMVILAVRQYWIIRPSDQLSSVVSEISAPSGGAAFGSAPIEPDLSWHDAGYPIEQYYLRRRRWERAIANASTGDELRAVAAAALTMASDIKELDTSRGVLQKQAVMPAPSELMVRHHARQVVAQAIDLTMARVNLVQKVQNYLTVFAFLLLGFIVAFSAHGWAAPMVMGAAAACLFRVRQVIPDGPSTLGGGARWMAMLLTPLIGAVAAVIGLVIVSALEGKVFTEGLVEPLNLPRWDVHAGQHRFSDSALAIAIALGWSAKLLDTLLSRVTSQVEGTTTQTAAAGPPPDPDPNPAGGTGDRPAETSPSQRAAEAKAAAESALVTLKAERARAKGMIESLLANPKILELFPQDAPLDQASAGYRALTPADGPSAAEGGRATTVAEFIEQVGSSSRGRNLTRSRQRLLDTATQLRTAAEAAEQAFLLQAEALALAATTPDPTGAQPAVVPAAPVPPGTGDQPPPTVVAAPSPQTRWQSFFAWITSIFGRQGAA